MNTCDKIELPTHIYNFNNSRVSISVKATDLADAIEWLKVIFGEHWVKYNIDDLEITWSNSYNK